MNKQVECEFHSFQEIGLTHNQIMIECDIENIFTVPTIHISQAFFILLMLKNAGEISYTKVC